MQLRFLNFNEIYDEKNLITNPDGIDNKKGKKGEDDQGNKKSKKFTNDGIFSEDIFGKMDNESIQYSCNCGKYKGKFYLGKVCEECETEVKYTESNILTTGWIDLGENHEIINPLFFNFLSKLGGKKFKDMIIFEKKLNKDGLIEDEKAKVSNPFYNIGLREFKNNFPEILEWLREKSTNKRSEKFYEIINKNKDIIFINKIPLFSPILRPALMMKDSLIFDKINNSYNQIIKNSNMINENIKTEETDINILPLLNDIQETFNEIYVKIIKALKGKNGFFRNNLMGNRINWSSRCVITPLPDGYDIDSLVIPYMCFMELYKFQLINLISSIKNVSLNEAESIWCKAITKYDTSMVKIINQFIEKGNCTVLFNRNPTINYGSIMKLKIVGIKTQYDDLTASLHNCILPPMGADYDGNTIC